MAAFQPRRAPSPPVTLPDMEVIQFLHPAYSSGNLLLNLPRVDLVSSETTPRTFGVHYWTALTACQIICNNVFTTGRLALDQAGQQLVDMASDGILTGERYYFFANSSPLDRYPVVASFKDWKFPHGQIPVSWPAPSTSAISGRCVVTNFACSLEKAHIVPREEEDWFLRNSMQNYNSPQEFASIHNAANILSLRHDIHSCFDNRVLSIVPKAFTPNEPPEYVVHFFSNNIAAAQYWPTHHDFLAQHIHPLARPYLFARFAWTIFFEVKRFVTCGIERHVIQYQINDKGEHEYVPKTLEGAVLMAAYGGGGSTGSKPSRKRSKAGSTMGEEEDFLDSSSEDFEMEDSTWDTPPVWSEERREDAGRTAERRNRSSDETEPDLGPELPPKVEAELRDTLAKVIPTTSQGDSDDVEMVLRLA